MLKPFVAGAERGDTLIEVIFATAVLALVIVVALGIMNSGTAQAQRAVEGTFVRQEIDSQTEMLRYARDAYVNKDTGADTQWNQITSHLVGTTIGFDNLDAGNCTPGGANAFYLVPNGTGLTVASGFSQPNTYAQPGSGLWVQAVRESSDPASPKSNYVDFYVYACWNPPAGKGKSTTGTVVRLYAPIQLF